MTYIGIDPAFRKNGFALVVIDETGEVVGRTFPHFLDFLEWLYSEESPAEAVVGVENSNRQNVTFAAGGSRAKAARHSRNVGTNQAVSQLTVDACVRKYGAAFVVDLSPAEKGKKWTRSLFTAALAQNRHTYKGKITQDIIDAYALALMASRRYSTRRMIEKARR